MHGMTNIAIRAAREAGKMLLRYYSRRDLLAVAEKSENDFVSEADQVAEETILAIIHRAYPDHAVLAEEAGGTGEGDYQWIIDPLDGTTNFLHGFPQFAVSIALRHKGRLEVAVIYDPLSQELFTATRGAGASLNDRRIRVSRRKGLEGALLGTGFPFKAQHHLETYLDMFRALFPQTAGIRRPGSAALDLAYLAAGRLDGFWEIGLNTWDMAAGILLVQEAGGLCGDFSGGHNHLQSGNLVAGNPKVFAEILKTIRPHVTSELAN